MAKIIGSSSSLVISIFYPLQLTVGHDIRAGVLHLGPVKIGHACTVGSFSVVFPDAVLQNGVEIDPMSLITATHVTQPCQVWRGSPAVLWDGHAPPLLRCPVSHGWCFSALQATGLLIVCAVFMSMFSVVFAMKEALVDTMGATGASVLMLSLGPIPIFVLVLVSVLVSKWALFGRMTPGNRELTVVFALRRWLADTMLSNTLVQLAANFILDNNVTGPAFLRLLGAKVGEGSFLMVDYFRSSLI